MVESRGVEVGVGRAWQRPAPDFPSRRVDAHDGIQSAVSDPGRTVRTNDHPVRGRAFPQSDLFDLAVRRVDPAKRALPLRRVPDRAAWFRVGRHVVWPCSARQLEVAHLRSLRAGSENKTGPNKTGQPSSQVIHPDHHRRPRSVQARSRDAAGMTCTRKIGNAVLRQRVSLSTANAVNRKTSRFSRAAVYIELNELPASTHASAGQSGAMQPRKGQAFPATEVDEKGVRNGKESTDRGN
ncbi:MAG: hypothetical protein AW09_002030 [Candidatus Accumulibacter phosphatis]|uniref:Uncharacterized protein n=1 Tax=Candidatus Accumulibacter phosphatis TaxID=327160 RepID=A0A080M6M9_9PROT|nr:MAG: hypothetical protein AW09_002030 [Candidatus Accumulibacter phosphatis]